MCDRTILKHQGKHNGEYIIIYLICTILTSSWCQCCVFAVGVLFHVLFTTRQFHIRTYTHKYMFTLFWTFQSTLISHCGCSKLKYIVLQRLGKFKENTTASVIFIFYYYNKFIVSVLCLCRWWVISYLIYNYNIFKETIILIVLCLHCFHWLD